jgi:hypothetical protein
VRDDDNEIFMQFIEVRLLSMVNPDVEVRACRRLQNAFKLPLPPARNNPFFKVTIAANIIIHLNSVEFINVQAQQHKCLL